MPPPSYREIKAQIAELEKQAAEMRKIEVAEVIATIRQMMTDYGLSIDDIALRKTVRRSGTPKYQDPVSGKTWTGSGRQPRWLAAAIAKGGKPEDFIITSAVAEKATATARTPAKRGATAKSKATPEKKGKAAPRAAAKRAKPEVAESATQASESTR